MENSRLFRKIYRLLERNRGVPFGGRRDGECCPEALHKVGMERSKVLLGKMVATEDGKAGPREGSLKHCFRAVFFPHFIVRDEGGDRILKNLAVLISNFHKTDAQPDSRIIGIDGVEI